MGIAFLFALGVVLAVNGDPFLVTMPVVIQSQKRKKCMTAGCRSRPRCAWLRWRKTVTETIVMCVTTSVKTTTCHQVAWVRPPAMKERM